jgi:hypothetical protein
MAVLALPISRLHMKIPFLKRMPAFVVLPITILIIVNCIVWAIVGIILRYHPYFFLSRLMVEHLLVR